MQKMPREDVHLDDCMHANSVSFVCIRTCQRGPSEGTQKRNVDNLCPRDPHFVVNRSICGHFWT
jgi:hypothetical protein